METTKKSQRRRGQRKFSKRKRSNAIGKAKVPPARASASVKNSHTSPRPIHRRKRIAEALGYRE
jgi:hypothetical protein